jgi:hypothetical protein
VTWGERLHAALAARATFMDDAVTRRSRALGFFFAGFETPAHPAVSNSSMRQKVSLL